MMQLLGASRSVRIPEWGAMYYDQDTDSWSDFGIEGNVWKFPGAPR